MASVVLSFFFLVPPPMSNSTQQMISISGPPTQPTTVIPNGYSIFMNPGETKLLGPFISNSTVRLYGTISSPNNPVVFYICKSVILDPSNKSAPTCSGNNNFVSDGFDTLYFGCNPDGFSDVVYCLPEGLTLQAGKYQMLIYAPYYSGVHFYGFHTTTKASSIADVIIPQWYVNPAFIPPDVTVVIGTNNTVRWINHDSRTIPIVADDHHDPLFAKVAQPESVGNAQNFLARGDSLEFTFTKVGVFRYHGSYLMHGQVTVLPGVNGK